MKYSVYDQFCMQVNKAGSVPSWSKMGFDIHKRQALIERILSFDRYKGYGLDIAQEIDKVLESHHQGYAIPMPWYVKIEGLEHTAQSPDEYAQRVVFGSFHSMLLFNVQTAIAVAQTQGNIKKMQSIARMYKQLEAKHPAANKTTDRAMLIWYILEKMPDFEWAIHGIYHQSSVELSKKAFFEDMDMCLTNGLISTEMLHLRVTCKNTFHTLKTMIVDGRDAQDIIRTHLDQAFWAAADLQKGVDEYQKRVVAHGLDMDKFGARIREILTMTEIESMGLVGQVFRGHRVNYKPFQKLVEEYLHYIQ